MTEQYHSTASTMTMVKTSREINTLFMEFDYLSACLILTPY